MTKILDFICNKAQNEVTNFLIQNKKFSEQHTTKYSTADFDRLDRWMSGKDTWFSVHLTPKGIYNCDTDVSESDGFGMY